ncbi:MAG: tRNA epoxyqueuosine(34) reductase QueG [Bacteriovorax sp.]|jgi:epoxyqueuosine reductase
MSLFDLKKMESMGIVDFGYTTEAVPRTLSHYNKWVSDADHLPLTYLEGERQEKRQNIKGHWSDFKSAVVFLFSYHESHQKLQKLYENEPEWNGLKMASYTLGFEGLDYHHLIKDRLIEVGESLKKDFPELEYKLALDTHPVLDRDLAQRSGIGWFGKNSMLINREQGSFFIIGSLLLNQELPIETKVVETDHCGQCTLCIDACPTQAIDPATRTIKAKDCISTFTIEQFKLDTVPSEKMTLKDGFIFGCDICQDVCPWNKRIDRMETNVEKSNNDLQNKIINFFLLRKSLEISSELEGMSEGTFKKNFQNTSFERSGKRGLLKNFRLYLKELNILP